MSRRSSGHRLKDPTRFPPPQRDGGSSASRGKGLCFAGQEVYPHCPKSLLCSGAWKPEEWLPADAQPTSAEVTLAQLRMPELTIADIEQAEADSLKFRYE